MLQYVSVEDVVVLGSARNWNPQETPFYLDISRPRTKHRGVIEMLDCPVFLI